MKKIYKLFLCNIATVIHYVTYVTVNSTCKISNYQDKEPHSLIRLKKIKDE